jgi:DNA-binding CsgD family transcriptional regulator
VRGGSDSGLIGAIYEAALDADLWPAVLEQFAQAFGSASAHLSLENASSTQGRMISYGCDPAWARHYERYYVTRNVLWQRVAQRPPTGVVTDRAIMPRDELIRSEFYNDFLRPQGGDEIMYFRGLQRTEATANFTLWRASRAGRWEDKDLRAFGFLTPHLSRSLQINRQIGDLRLVNDLAVEALYQITCGVILVDPGASMLFANRAAERLFDGDGLRLERGRLATSRSADTATLHRLIAVTAQSGSGNSMVIERPARRPLLVLTAPMAARTALPAKRNGSVILFVRDMAAPPPNLTAFARHFGLTAAEAAIAAELVKADGVTAAAVRLGISRATARTHLIHIFQKTATRRQAELVRLMLTWAEPPTSAPDRA